MNQETKTRVALSIAGLDPSGGAGIIADLKTFAAFGVYGAAVLTSVTFQNTQGVFGAEPQTAESVRGQVAPIYDDFAVDAVKTGMLPTRTVIDEVAAMSREFRFANLVVDPVVRSTSGFDLIDDDALRSLVERLFPLAAIVTPNAAETERITGIGLRRYEDIVRAAERISALGARAVLIKGGHLRVSDLGFGIADLQPGEGFADSGWGKFSRPAVDFLFVDGNEHRFVGEYIETTSTHGTGCTLAAAIAAGLALGDPLITAVDRAKRYVNAAIRTAPKIGKGNSPINHAINP